MSGGPVDPSCFVRPKYPSAHALFMHMKVTVFIREFKMVTRKKLWKNMIGTCHLVSTVVAESFPNELECVDGRFEAYTVGGKRHICLHSWVETKEDRYKIDVRHVYTTSDPSLYHKGTLMDEALISGNDPELDILNGIRLCKTSTEFREAIREAREIAKEIMAGQFSEFLLSTMT